MKFKNSNNEWQTLKIKNYGIEQTPIGSMIYYPAQNIPNGYLVCDGSEILISEYEELFNVIGYIGGDDVLEGYFRLPDMQGVIPGGWNPNLVGIDHPLAGAFGDQVGNPRHALTVEELASHHHGVSDDLSTDMRYTMNLDWNSDSVARRMVTPSEDSNVTAMTANLDAEDSTGTGDIGQAAGTGYTGEGQEFSIVQPTKLYHWLIKAKNVVTLGGHVENFEVEGDLNILGKITMPQDKYITDGAGINMNNSDIININGLYLNDVSDVNHEGINFLKENGDVNNQDDYECLKGYNGNAYYNNTRLLTVDDLYYKAGDSTYLHGFSTFGHMTSSATSIVFTIHPTMRLDNVSTMTITGGTITVRGVLGYVEDSYNTPIPLTGGTYEVSTIKRNANTFLITVNKTEDWVNTTNNTPLSVYLNGVTVTFS